MKFIMWRARIINVCDVSHVKLFNEGMHCYKITVFFLNHKENSSKVEVVFENEHDRNKEFDELFRLLKNASEE